MLDKEFVPHTESYELKELGFDEPCFGVYGYNKLSNSVPDELIDKTVLTFIQDIIENEEFKLEPNDLKNSNIGNDTSAPTFSQAFRWFRKNYNLHPAIYPIKQHWECDIRHTNKNTNSSIFSWDNEFEYEEAELACLRKLIEIVKNKENVA